jgi:DNA-directed RNA polymerase subunit beta
VRVFSRKGTERDERAKEIDDQERAKLEKDMTDEIKIIRDSAYNRVKRILEGKVTTGKLVNDRGRVLFAKGEEITQELLGGVPRRYWRTIPVEEGADKVEQILDMLQDQEHAVEMLFREKISRLSKGDELPPGVIKMVKVYVAIKRKLAVGDKMAGRHGNKGVISRILPEEDMPFLQDGTPLELVLNPLGVPSRMNVGQILECHLGWAAVTLGNRIQWIIDHGGYSDEAIRTQLCEIFDSPTTQELIKELEGEQLIEFARTLNRGVHLACPVFDGADEGEIREALKLAGLPTQGQTVLFDGKTGKAFEQDVTVGIMYMLKLHHLVDDKIHARSIGPYSLVTQQPLGGKAQFGGQRLGEMEVWAMEAYGAAYALQEFLTVKSDDVMGRTRMYEAIVKGEHTLEAGLPESFNVLIKELQSLCLNVELIEE